MLLTLLPEVLKTSSDSVNQPPAHVCLVVDLPLYLRGKTNPVRKTVPRHADAFASRCPERSKESDAYGGLCQAIDGSTQVCPTDTQSTD